jgi:hypothetical protein
MAVLKFSVQTGSNYGMSSLVIDGPVGMIVFTDRALAGVGGGGGGITRASYTPYGESLSAIPGGAPGAHFGIPKGTQIPSLGLGPITGSGGGAIGSAFGRARFAQELAAKPWLKDRLFHIAAGEDSPGSASGTLANQAIMESAMNRAITRGTSLEAQLGRAGHGGYYAGWSNYSAAQRAIMDQNLGKVLGGSNVSGYATDNSSSWLAAKEKRTGSFRHLKDIHGESFFAPGLAERKWAREWDKLVQQDGLHGHALRDHFGYRGRHNPEHPSSAIPHPQKSSLETPIVMHMDGDVVARGAMKRIVGGLNGPAKGGRMPDFSSARPVSI